MLSTSQLPNTGSESNDASSTTEWHNSSSTDSELSQQQHQHESFPEIYRSTLADVPPHNFGCSDATDSSFIKHWPSGSLHHDADDDQSMNENSYKKSESPDATASSGPGSGDILSDEDRERLGSIQRGENTAIAGWLKNLGNHRSHQGQKNHKGLNTEQNKQQSYTCQHQPNKNHHHKYRLNNAKNNRSHHHRMGRHDKPSMADDELDFSSFEDSNNSQYEGMDSATGPFIESSETTSESNGSNCSPDSEIRNRKLSTRSSRKRTRDEAMPECNDVIDDLVIRNKNLKKRLRRLEDLYLGHRPPASNELFEVRYFSMPQDKKRELESCLREFATHIRINNQSTKLKSGTSGSSSEGLTDQSPNSANIYNNSNVPPMNVPVANRELTDSQNMPGAWTLSRAQVCEVSNFVEETLTKPNLQQRDVIRSNSIDGWLPLKCLYEASSELNDMTIPLSYLRHCLRRGSRHVELSKDQTRVRLKQVVMTGDSSNKDTGSDSTGSSFSGNNVVGSTFWALRPDMHSSHVDDHSQQHRLTSVSQPVASAHDISVDSSSFRPYTPCFSNRNVVSSVSSRDESDHAKRRTDSSNWSSDEAAVNSMYNDTYDERYGKDKDQPQLQQSMQNSLKQQQPFHNPAEAAKVAPIIYIEGGTFCLDLSRFQRPHEAGPEEDDIPEYVRDSEAVLGQNWDDDSKWQDLFCWNCESKHHTLRDCSQKFDDTLLCKNALEFARRYPDHQCNFRRYFDETELRQHVEDMVVGKPSDELKEALGVAKDDLIMPYYDKMLNQGYPPGWKGVIRTDAHKQGKDIHKNPSDAAGKLKVWDSGRLVQISAYDSDTVQSIPNTDVAKAGGDDGPVKFRDGTTKLVVDGKIGSHYHAAIGAEQRAKHKHEPKIQLVDYPGLRWRDEEFKPTNESQSSRADSGIGSSHGGSEVSFKHSKKHKDVAKEYGLPIELDVQPMNVS